MENNYREPSHAKDEHVAFSSILINWVMKKVIFTFLFIFYNFWSRTLVYHCRTQLDCLCFGEVTLQIYDILLLRYLLELLLSLGR